MTRKRVAQIAVVLLVVIGGGIAAGLLLTESDSSNAEHTPHYTYPQSAVDTIISSCEKRLKRKTCLCVVAAYKSTMPYSTFRDFSRQGATAQTTAVFRTFQAKTAACPR